MQRHATAARTAGAPRGASGVTVIAISAVALVFVGGTLACNEVKTGGESPGLKAAEPTSERTPTGHGAAKRPPGVGSERVAAHPRGGESADRGQAGTGTGAGCEVTRTGGGGGLENFSSRQAWQIPWLTRSTRAPGAG